MRLVTVGLILAGLVATALSTAMLALASVPAAGFQERLASPSQTVTVVMTDMEPFVMADGPDPEAADPDGFYAEIWDAVADDLEVDYEVVWVDTFGELLPTLDTGAAQIAIAPIAPTAEREAIYDFSSAVISSGPQLGYHERIENHASIFRALLDWRVLQILLIAAIGLIVLAHVMWLLERNRPGEDGAEGDFHPTYLRGVWDGVWWSTVTATTVGYGDKAPRSSAGRAVALVTMLLSLFLVGAFVSQVTDVLAENRAFAPFDDIESLDDRMVGVVADTSFADFLVGEGARTKAFPNQEAVFEAAGSGEIDAVLANPFALSEVGPRHGLVSVGDVLYEEFETFGLAQDSPWREPINQALARLQASGEVEEIIQRWLK